jgi:hypothetical protein
VNDSFSRELQTHRVGFLGQVYRRLGVDNGEAKMVDKADDRDM